jgi:glycine betaine/proline transport system substrate-binding protein
MTSRATLDVSASSVGAVLCTVLVIAGCTQAPERATSATGPPESDVTGEVVMARADWDSGFLQAAIVRQLLEELGYEVTGPAERTYPPATVYPLLGRGEVDLWVNGWFPLHEPFLEQTLVTGQTVAQPVEPVGTLVPAGAVQGYLVDRETAEELDITSMADFERPEVAAAFDQDGDGLADLYGCDEGWGCHRTITEHLAQHRWGDSVAQVSGDYRELFAEVRERIDAGRPALYYTWTPNWTVAELEPGDEVVWLEVPALGGEEPPPVDELEGCAASGPCHVGWEVNDIRAVANTRFLDEHPPIRRLLEVVELPLEDLTEHHARMVAMDPYPDDQVELDAAEWIEQNRELVDRWLSAAAGPT